MLTLTVVLAACVGSVSEPAETTSTPAPPPPSSTTTITTTPPTGGSDRVIDWSDSSPVALEDGWTVRSCEGDAPILCVERDGNTVGGVEANAFPIASFDALDPGADDKTNLQLFARSFLDTFEADRAAGCGADYRFAPIDPEPFPLGGEVGITYGFVGTTADDEPSELNLQYATIQDDHVVTVVAVAYDEGGCPGRDELSGFDSESLAAFRPYLEEILKVSPLPDLGI